MWLLHLPLIFARREHPKWLNDPTSFVCAMWGGVGRRNKNGRIVGRWICRCLGLLYDTVSREWIASRVDWRTGGLTERQLNGGDVDNERTNDRSQSLAPASITDKRDDDDVWQISIWPERSSADNVSRGPHLSGGAGRTGRAGPGRACSDTERWADPGDATLKRHCDVVDAASCHADATSPRGERRTFLLRPSARGLLTRFAVKRANSAQHVTLSILESCDLWSWSIHGVTVTYVILSAIVAAFVLEVYCVPIVDVVSMHKIGGALANCSVCDYTPV